MPEINLPTKATQDLIKTGVDTINTKVGTNADAGGTTTLFARLKQIYDYLVSNLSTTRASKIDNLDATISSRASQASLDSLVGGTRWEEKVPNFYNFYGAGILFTASQSIDIATLTGPFILTDLNFYQNTPKMGLILVIDGVAKPLYYSGPGETALIPALAGSNSQSNSTASATILKISAPIAVNTSLIFRLVNLNSVGSESSTHVINATYHT